jgi:hypothetical protein
MTAAVKSRQGRISAGADHRVSHRHRPGGRDRATGARCMNRDPGCAEWEPVLRAIGSAEAELVPKIYQCCDTFRRRAPPCPAATCCNPHVLRAPSTRTRRDWVGDRRPQQRGRGGDLAVAGGLRLTPWTRLGPAAPAGSSAPAAPVPAAPPTPPGPGVAVHGTANRPQPGPAGTPNGTPRKPCRRAAWIDAVPTTHRWRGPEMSSPRVAAAVAASMETRS